MYIACSLDGFIAGPNDDLSWLPGADGTPMPPADEAIGYEEFMADIGALLMGRGTYDVASGFEGNWQGDAPPILVATTRPLEPVGPTIRAVSGDITVLVKEALEAAGGKDVYLDGGNLIRQALDAGLIDDMIITLVPVVLGEGHALFAGVSARHRLEFVSHVSYGGGMVQLRARPKR